MRIGKIKSVCSICNEINEVDEIYSSSTFGTPDLDLRPGFMSRYTVSYEIKRCQKCGYCNTDLEKNINNSSKIISSTAYKKQLKMKGPKKSNDYCCLAMILKENNLIVEAGWSYMKASWICDDKQKNTHAKRCRQLAFEMFMDALNQNISFLPTRGAEKILLADIKRRMSEYDESNQICIKALKFRLNKSSRKILKYQQLLNTKKDNKVYTYEEAMK